jgi:hypothetical protein
VHELVDRAVDKGLVKFGISVQTQRSIGIEDAQESGGIGTLAAFHVAMIGGSAQEHVLQNLLLAQVEAGGNLEGLAVRGSEPHRKLHAVELGVPAGIFEIDIGNRAQGVAHIVLVVGRFFDFIEQRGEILAEQGLQQPVLAAKVIIQCGFFYPGGSGHFLNSHGIKTTPGKQVKGTGKQFFAIVHKSVYHSVHRMSI